jgi:hypothetical protein
MQVAHAYNPSYSEGRDQERSQFKASPGKMKARPYLKNTQHKIGLGEVQVVECLPNKCEALSTTHTYTNALESIFTQLYFKIMFLSPSSTLASGINEQTKTF